MCIFLLIKWNETDPCNGVDQKLEFDGSLANGKKRPYLAPAAVVAKTSQLHFSPLFVNGSEHVVVDAGGDAVSYSLIAQ